MATRVESVYHQQGKTIIYPSPYSNWSNYLYLLKLRYGGHGAGMGLELDWTRSWPGLRAGLGSELDWI